MRKFSAHFILTGTGVLLNKGIVVTTDQGVIMEIIDTNGAFEERSSVEFYSGIITPGFVNAALSPKINMLKPAHQKWTMINAIDETITKDLFAVSQNELQETNRICLGLKSAASNDQQALFKLIKDLCSNFPMISLAQVVTWATKNGAEALSISDRYGSIEIGKQPGLNLLTGLDMGDMTIKSTSVLEKLF